MFRHPVAAALVTAGGIAFAPLAWAGPEGAEPAEVGDRYDLSIRSETTVELFRRALLPGPNGALVQSETVAPVHEYLTLEAHDLDAGWQKDSLDVEVSTWGRTWFGDRETERLFDGDVQTAYVAYRQGPVALRLGRQNVGGGAARFTRFDGLRLSSRVAAGLDVDAYGGLAVLPRWNAQPGYYQLGAASDTLLKDPEAIPEPNRTDYWLGGGRLGWSSTRAGAGFSFHEQRESLGLSRRTLGVDARASVVKDVSAGASGLFELEAERVQDARIWLDTTPVRPLDISLEYLHTEPALFLSRQSVLSVFSTDAYDEPALGAVFRATDRFSLESRGSLQIYDTSRTGARGEIGARVLPGEGRRTVVRLAYTRVLALENGYHAIRASLGRRFLARLSGTLEAYAYLYDEAIRNRTTSEVYSGTLSYRVLAPFELTWGASVAQSPYARSDVQTIVRASYVFETPGSTLP